MAPMFLLTIFAEALADVVDPRRLLTGAQVSVVALGVRDACRAHWDSALALLMTTFVLSAAGALAATAWRIITPMLVPKTELGDTITVSNAAIARADARRRPRLKPVPRTQRPDPVDRDLARPFATEAQAPGGTGGQGRRSRGAKRPEVPQGGGGGRAILLLRSALAISGGEDFSAADAKRVLAARGRSRRRRDRYGARGYALRPGLKGGSGRWTVRSRRPALDNTVDGPPQSKGCAQQSVELT